MKKSVFFNTVAKKYAMGYIIMGFFVLVFLVSGALFKGKKEFVPIEPEKPKEEPKKQPEKEEKSQE